MRGEEHVCLTLENDNYYYQRQFNKIPHIGDILEGHEKEDMVKGEISVECSRNAFPCPPSLRVPLEKMSYFVATYACLFLLLEVDLPCDLIVSGYPFTVLSCPVVSRGQVNNKE